MVKICAHCGGNYIGVDHYKNKYVCMKCNCDFILELTDDNRNAYTGVG